MFSCWHPIREPPHAFRTVLVAIHPSFFDAAGPPRPGPPDLTPDLQPEPARL